MRSDETKGNEKDFAKPKGDEDDAKEISVEAPEAPKDYIHVQGKKAKQQIAIVLLKGSEERRSQRMKLLQILYWLQQVPVDEVSHTESRLEFNLESLFPKERLEMFGMMSQCSTNRLWEKPRDWSHLSNLQRGDCQQLTLGSSSNPVGFQ
ncbi:hypothetical protein HPP92_000358 [Vanilla planifolia]|uniref:Uncharacterized protein n=1 Tax=Vanilla planifolia TaxID=51239 RepID=A0A835VEB9_VANPL|nr:hypothetical protein HPP92_000358 [Vanilla planifolia]